MARGFISITFILVSLLLFLSANSLLGTLLAVRMTAEGFSTQIIGPILAFHSVGFVLGTLYCPQLIKRVGHIRTFSALAAIACASSLIHALQVDVVTWAVLRAAVGFCAAGLMTVMESWINDRTTNQARGTIMAFYMATYYLSLGGGQFLLAIGDPNTTFLFMVVAILTVLSLIPTAVTRSTAPHIEEHERMGFRKLYRLSPVGMVGAIIAGTVMSAFMAIGPVYGHAIGLSVGQISLFMGSVVFAGMLLQWPAGHASDRLDRRWVIITLTTAATLPCLALAFFTDLSFLMVMVLSGLFMGLVSSLYPLSVSVVNDYLHSHQIISASATLLLSFGIGTIIGPVVGSMAIQLLGAAGLFLFISSGLILLVLFAIFRILHSRRFPVEAQSGYISMAANTTPTILEIDPRNDEFHEYEPPRRKPTDPEPDE